MLDKIRIITDTTDRKNLFLLFILLLIVTFLELLGLGSIPIFAMVILDPQSLSEKIPLVNNYGFIENIEANDLIYFMSIVLVVIFIIKNLFIAFVNYFNGKLIQRVRGNLTNNLFKSYLHANYEFHIKKNSADLIRNVYSEVSKSVYFLTGFIIIFKETLILLMIFSLLLISNASVAFYIFILLALFSVIFFLYTRSSSQMRGKLIQEFWGRQTRTLKHGIGSIKEIKILSKENFITDLFNHNNNNIEKYTFVQSFIVTLPRLVLETLTIIGICVLSILFVFSGQPIENYLPLVALITVSAVRMMPSFNAISQAIATVKYQTPAFELIVRELKNLSEEKNKDLTRINSKNIKKISFQNKIEIKNLSYKYPADFQKYVFKNLSTNIEFGEIVGISGPSGVGKSTLVDLLTGLLKPSDGKIIIDGIDIHNENTDWHNYIGYVHQDTYLIDDTIQANIAFGVPEENINSDDLNNAIKLARLTDLIKNLDRKEKTYVGEDGIRLSGGEKQRIGIARALYFKPKVLFLDEPTSSLDPNNENLILNDIYNLVQNRTVVIISHRLNVFKYCKKILNFNQDKIEILENYKNLL